MPISAELAAVLGRKLLVKYLAGDGVPRPSDDLIPSAEDIAKGVTELVKDFNLDLGGITEGDEVTEQVLKLIVKGVKKIQQETGRLKPDGVIGARTKRWIFGRRFGHHDRPIESLPESNTKSTPQAGVLRYFLEDDLPPVPRAINLLKEAWDSWSEVLKLDIKQTGVADKGDANVIIKTGIFPGNILAKADVGPPGNRQLNLTFDTSETWTAAEFQGTAAHEIGHLLGLPHITQKNQLMNNFLDVAIITPQKFDIEAAVEVGWKER